MKLKIVLLMFHFAAIISSMANAVNADNNSSMICWIIAAICWIACFILDIVAIKQSHSTR